MGQVSLSPNFNSNSEISNREAESINEEVSKAGKLGSVGDKGSISLSELKIGDWEFGEITV